MKVLFAVLFVLCILSMAHADTFSDNFESYNPPPDGPPGIALAGQGGWVTGEANGAATSTGVKIYDDWGIGNSDAIFIEAPGYEHIAHSVGTLAVGDQIRILFQIAFDSPGYGELWVGDAKHVDGTLDNEVSLWVRMSIGPGHLISYNLSSDNPVRNTISGIQLNDGSGGQAGHVCEIRMTLITSGRPAFGIDSAVVEARNVTTGSEWQYIGVVPLNAQGIGWDNLYVVLGGEQVMFDNLSVTHSATAACDFIHQWGYGFHGDIIADCSVDALDLGALATKWTSCNNPAAPINCDLTALGGQTLFSDDLDSHPTPTPESGVGNTGPLIGVGGWLADDFKPDTAIQLNEGWGFPGTADNNGAYWRPDGGESGAAHYVGALSPGDQIGYTFFIGHANGYLDLAIGTNLANGDTGDDNKIHIEMGGSGNLCYYRMFDTSNNVVSNPNPWIHSNIDAGAMQHHVEAFITMGPGLNSFSLQVRNLSRHYNSGTGQDDVGPADWQDVGTVSTGGLSGTDFWISFTGQSGSAPNWSQSVMFDNVSVSRPAPTNCDEVHSFGLAMAFDLVPDCKIDLGDLAALALDFGRCNAPSDPTCEVNYLLPQPTFLAFGPDLTSDGFAAWGDTNNDGWVDLYTLGIVWRNNAGAGLTNSGTMPAGVIEGIFADFDNDGDLDLAASSQKTFLTNSGPPSYSFSVSPTYPAVTYLNSHGASWADYNKDGFVDLYTGGFLVGGTAYKDALLLSTAGTSFSTAWETSFAYAARGITSCDFDKDGDMDIFVSTYSQPNWQPNLLWVNNGSDGFTDQANSFGVTGDATPNLPALNPYGHTIGSAWGDLDSDGDFDLFTGNLNHHDGRWADDSKFYRNDGSSFTDMTAGAGLAWKEFFASPALADFDNDGFLDLYLTTIDAGEDPVLYRNNGDWTFTDVTTDAGLANLGTTSQAAWADFDNDGDMDLVTAGRLYLNTGNGNHWLKVRLESLDAAVNRMAIGAQVRIDLGGGKIVTRQVESGTGEGCQNEGTLHFGLGDRVAPVNVEVFWPDGTTSQHNNVNVDALIVINY